MEQLNVSMAYQQVCDMVRSVQKNGVFFSVQQISEVEPTSKMDEFVLIEWLEPYNLGGCRERSVVEKSVVFGRKIVLLHQLK
jgi:hypothetical protein